jgi:hypothetical protein
MGDHTSSRHDLPIEKNSVGGFIAAVEPIRPAGKNFPPASDAGMQVTAQL